LPQEPQSAVNARLAVALRHFDTKNGRKDAMVEQIAAEADRGRRIVTRSLRSGIPHNGSSPRIFARMRQQHSHCQAAVAPKPTKFRKAVRRRA
jgi:hypothetical protein